VTFSIRLVPRALLDGVLLGLLPGLAAVAGAALLIRDLPILIGMVVVLVWSVLADLGKWSLSGGPVGLTAVRPAGLRTVTTWASWEDLVGVGRLRGLTADTQCFVFAQPQHRQGPARLLATEAQRGLDRVVPVGSFVARWPDAEVVRAAQAARPDLDLAGGSVVPLPEPLTRLEATIKRRYALAVIAHLLIGAVVAALLLGAWRLLSLLLGVAGE
jgi:hypothetical protein